MKRIVLFTLALMMWAGPPARLSAAPDGVESLNGAFLKALQAGDLDGVMKLYAPDAVLFPPGEKAARGLEEIRFKWSSTLKANRIKEGRFQDAKYLTSAGVSAGWGDITLALEPKSGKEPVTIQGRFSTVAQKRDGKWLYVFVGIAELDEILTLKHYSKPPK